jgi:hypothetical protein
MAAMQALVHANILRSLDTAAISCAWFEQSVPLPVYFITCSTDEV